jgi:Co-chaperonin GroES (HSP10)
MNLRPLSDRVVVKRMEEEKPLRVVFSFLIVLKKSQLRVRF